MADLGTATIIRADARSLPIADASVDLIVTSPPYFGLRSYTDSGEHYDGQIGSESTPGEYIDNLIDCTREWVRVLKPSGSIFVNLGDSYYSGKGAPGCTTVDAKNAGRTARRTGTSALDRSDLGFPRKSLLLLPERYRIGCLDDLGLTARAVICWSKPNAMPESVTDRVRRSHEDWVHLTIRPDYFSAVDAIREPSDPRNVRPQDRRGEQSTKDTTRRRNGHAVVGHPGKALEFNPLGKLPGSVWEIATEPLIVPDHLGVDHYAAFPTEWPRRLILGWSPSGICTSCDEGRRPVVVRASANRHNGGGHDIRPHAPDNKHGRGATSLSVVPDFRIVGEKCGCPDSSAPTRPSVVLDPFGGSGTTALIAKALGRHGISVDRSADYCRIAKWRTTDPGQLAKALRVPRPAVQTDGQISLDLEGLAS